MKNSKTVKWVRNVGFLAVSIVLLWLVFRKVNFKETLSIVLEANFGFLVLSRTLSLAAHWLRAIRWNLLITTVGHQPSTINSFKAVMIGYLANFGLPKMGEVYRCWSLNKTDQVPISKLLGTVVIERAIDLLSLLTVIGIVFIISFQEIKSFFYDKVVAPLMDKGAGITSNPVIWFIAISAILALLVLWYFQRNKALPEKLASPIKGLVEGLKSILQLKKSGQFILLSIVIWVVYWMNVLIDFQAFQYTENLGIEASLVILMMGGLGMAAPTQGGIGAYHFMITQALIFLGLTYTQGLAYATLVHASVLLLTVIVGGLCLLSVLLNKDSEKKAKLAARD